AWSALPGSRRSQVVEGEGRNIFSEDVTTKTKSLAKPLSRKEEGLGARGLTLPARAPLQSDVSCAPAQTTIATGRDRCLQPASTLAHSVRIDCQNPAQDSSLDHRDSDRPP